MELRLPWAKIQFDSYDDMPKFIFLVWIPGILALTGVIYSILWGCGVI